MLGIYFSLVAFWSCATLLYTNIQKWVNSLPNKIGLILPNRNGLTLSNKKGTGVDTILSKKGLALLSKIELILPSKNRLTLPNKKRLTLPTKKGFTLPTKKDLHYYIPTKKDLHYYILTKKGLTLLYTYFMGKYNHVSSVNIVHFNLYQLSFYVKHLIYLHGFTNYVMLCYPIFIAGCLLFDYDVQVSTPTDYLSSPSVWEVWGCCTKIYGITTGKYFTEMSHYSHWAEHLSKLFTIVFRAKWHTLKGDPLSIFIQAINQALSWLYFHVLINK